MYFAYLMLFTLSFTGFLASLIYYMIYGINIIIPILLFVISLQYIFLFGHQIKLREIELQLENKDFDNIKEIIYRKEFFNEDKA